MSWFEEQDKKYLHRLKVKSYLDFALNIPTKYEDTYLSKELLIDKENTLRAKVISTQRVPKYLKVKFYALDFGVYIDGIIFHPKPFHYKLFDMGSEIYIKGRVERNFSSFSIVQPKVIKEINTINTFYKYGVRNNIVKKLIKKYLSKELLKKAGLTQKESEIIYAFHFPTTDMLKLIEEGAFVDILKFVEIYNHLKRLSRKKSSYLSSDRLCGDLKEFENSLPFCLTNDQKKAIEDIKRDFCSKYAAKRVIVGDVGCGKTMVMLAAAVLAYPKRSILMAPTSLLASQIYSEAKKFLPSCFKVAFVSSKESVDNLEDYDFIIGTHALLYKKLPKCSLVMIDEQHRFGVNQREMIKNLVKPDQKGRRAHFLQFSATPIPRTLAMINSSLVDYSFIKETPFKKDISTYIIDKGDFKRLLEHIKREIKLSHQVAIIYPIVTQSESIEYQGIDEAKEYWQKRFDNVFITHGKDKNKEQILEDFKKSGDILISTTVIEVGISLPRLSTVVVVGAERLGLATLHQIRGRVSRTGLKGYCFLYTNHKDSKRLKEFAKTTNGFDIAELDLKFRQSGDVVDGKLQSGKTFRWIELGKDEEIIAKAKERIKLTSLKKLV